MLLALLLDAVDNHLAVVLHRGGLVGQAVRNTQSAAGVQHANLHARLGLDLGDEVDDDLDGFGEAVQGEDLAPDVHVQTVEVDTGEFDRLLDRLHGQPLVAAKAELRVLGARHDEVVRVGLHARRDPDEYLLLDAARVGQRRETIHLLEAVDDDASDARVEALGQLERRLVVAVDIDALHREARAQREGELAAARDVEAAALLGDDLEHRDRHERLAGVDGVDIGPVVAGPRDVLTELMTNRRLVHDVDSGTGLCGERHGIESADPQVTILDLSGHRQHSGQVVRGLHIRRGWRSRGARLAHLSSPNLWQRRPVGAPLLGLATSVPAH